MRFTNVTILKVLFTLIIFSSSWAQTKEKCRSATNYYTKKIQDLYQKQLIDSFDEYIQEWDQACEDSEELLRFKILWAIKSGSFSESQYDENIIAKLIAYREKIYLEENLLSLNKYQRELKKYIYSNKNFNNFTQTLASEIIQSDTSISSLSYMFAEYYSNCFDNFFIKLNEPIHMNSNLHSYYMYYLNNFQNSLETNIKIISGYWVPFGSMNIFNPHPSLGIAFGVRSNKKTVQFVSCYRFLKGSDEFVFDSGNRKYDNSTFLHSYYLGIEGSRDLITASDHEYYLGLGLGYEKIIIDIPTAYLTTDRIDLTLINFGFGYKHYWGKGKFKYSDIQILTNKYFAAQNENSYSIALRITYGFNLNRRKVELLKYLHR